MQRFKEYALDVLCAVGIVFLMYAAVIIAAAFQPRP